MWLWAHRYREESICPGQDDADPFVARTSLTTISTIKTRQATRRGNAETVFSVDGRKHPGEMGVA